MVTKYVFLGVLTIQFVIPSSYLGNSSVADASIRTAVSSILGIEATAAQTEVGTNSQKMPLLEAPVNTHLVAQSSSTTIVENSALIAPTSPITATAATNTPVTASSNPKTTKITSYKVQPGDTLSGIAKKFGISEQTIDFANAESLTNKNALKVGQTLVILPISGIEYTVRAGDTINGIADKYKGDAQEIISYNNITDGKLISGKTIVIPDGELAYTPAPKTTAKTSVVQKVASAALGVSVAKAEVAQSTSGYFTRPIKGGTRTQGIHGNNGVDIAASCGTTLYAAAAGTVSVALNNGGYNGGFGNYVVVDHDNGSQTLYAHMQSVSVSMGETVTKGEVIGALGNTGKVHGVTGCHVHFEVHGGKNPF